MDNEELITLTKCDNTIVADEIVSNLASHNITASLHDELNDLMTNSTTLRMALMGRIQVLR